MFKKMSYDSLMIYGISTVYGVKNLETNEVILVSDLRRFHGEFVVERGNIMYGFMRVWSSTSKEKCIDKVNRIANI